MFMHHWSIGLARIYALQALEEEIRRSREARDLGRREGRSGKFHAVANRLVNFAHRLARRSPAEPRPLGCG
jgi:hypothetical protein